MDDSRVRAWWSHRQGLDGALQGKTAAEVLERSGWARSVGGLIDLPDHAIVDRKRIFGLWEYDIEAESIVWATFGMEDKALIAAIKETERYVREELGDARAFSLDSPKSRIPRIQVLRKAARK